MTRDTMRILAQDRLISNNTRTTKLNNNDLIIGPTGAGKTRSYVKPNLLQYALEGGCSLIIADTKGSLVEEVGPVMAAHGYKVINLDFINLMNNSVGYNPLDFVSYDPAQKGYSEQEILTISSALVPIETKRDPFWEQSAQIFLSAFIGYALETLPPEEHTLEAVVQLYRNLSQTKQGGGRCFPHQSPRSAVSGLWMLSPARTFSPEARPHSGHFPGPH